jgi:hypothetical protein
MSTIIIKADNKSGKLLWELAKKMGASVLSVKDEQFEDFALATMMDAKKTNDLVSRDLILKKLEK